MHGQDEEIRRRGAQVLVVSFARAEKAKAFLGKHLSPYQVVCDPDRQAYQAFALRRTPWWSMLLPWVIGRYLLLMIRGWRAVDLDRNEDLLQLGGDFVLDADQRLLFAYPSKNSTDRPKPEELIGALPNSGN